MADARALLRAKRQEARITHPLASYNTAGQLRCIICGILVKYASAWEGHLGSKAHRTNVARVKEEERLREEARKEEEKEELRREAEAEALRSKRKAGDEGPELETESNSSSKKQKLDSSFPADFFSDPSNAPVIGSDSDDEEAEVESHGQTAQAPSAIDLEYERFERELLGGPDFRETYERATVMAEPVLVSGALEGFPERRKVDEEVAVEEQAEPTEEEKRQQKEIEEKELIMDRLLEEERVQEEADMKVQMMKNRVEAFKKQRELARSTRVTGKAS